MIDETFVILGAGLIILGSVSYLRDTLKGKVKPNRVSWLLWAIAPLIAFGAELQNGVGLASVMTFAIGFGPLLIFVGSFANRKSSWRLTKLDVACGLVSLTGLILWRVTGHGDLAIIFSILADGAAAVPTLIKSYKSPESEKWYVYFFWAISAAITLLALDVWTFAHYAFPIYVLLLGVVLSVIIKTRLGRAAVTPRENVGDLSQ